MYVEIIVERERENMFKRCFKEMMIIRGLDYVIWNKREINYMVF